MRVAVKCELVAITQPFTDPVDILHGYSGLTVIAWYDEQGERNGGIHLPHCVRDEFARRERGRGDIMDRNTQRAH